MSQHSSGRHLRNNVILLLIGLALTLIGALGLTFAIGFSKTVYSPLYYEDHETRYIRLEKKDGTYVQLKTVNGEIIVASSYILLSLGFLFQLIDYIIIYTRS